MKKSFRTLIILGILALTVVSCNLGSLTSNYSSSNKPIVDDSKALSLEASLPDPHVQIINTFGISPKGLLGELEINAAIEKWEENNPTREIYDIDLLYTTQNDTIMTEGIMIFSNEK